MFLAATNCGGKKDEKMAKGRQPGVLVFGIKTWIEGVARQNLGLPFAENPSTKDEGKILQEVETIKTEMKGERSLPLTQTKSISKVVALFENQLRASLTEVPKMSLKDMQDRFDGEREARLAAEKELEEVKAQLARATEGKKKSA
jgi:hypothetical protein